MSKISKIMTAVFCIFFIVYAFFDVENFIENSRAGFLLVAQNVVPILFPFFFITGLLIELDLFSGKTVRAGTVILSYLAGYPTSSRMVASLYKSNRISMAQAIRIATYTSVASPIFTIATVGTALLSDTKLGVLIWVSTVLGATCNALIYKGMPDTINNIGITQNRATGQLRAFMGTKNTADCISTALTSAITSIFSVAGIIVIFFILSAPLGVFSSSVLEMTTGVFRVSNLLHGAWRVIIPTAIISFGGICVACQSYVFLKDFKMPIWYYFLYKMTHTVFAMGFCTVLYFIVF